MSIKSSEEIRLKGHALSGGIAIGRSFFHKAELQESLDTEITSAQIQSELTHFKKAVNSTIHDLQELKKQLEAEYVVEGASIIESQIYLMHDPMFVGEIEAQIAKKLKKADFVLQSLVKQFKKKFAELEDPYFKERFHDVQDVARRLLSYLKNGVKYTLPESITDTILFIDHLTPAETAEASKKNVKAIVSEKGSTTAHATILARAKEIPYMTNIPISKLFKQSPDMVIVDGKTGELIINPTEETLSKYTKLLAELRDRQANLTHTVDLEPVTLDGFKLRLMANIENIDEVDQIHQSGGVGVGLFRSENILVNQSKMPSEEEQFLLYRDLIGKMKGLPTTIRVFDVGRDKKGVYGGLFQGFRAIGSLKNEKKIYMTQLRAIYRAGKFGPVNVLFPMISSLPELLEAKKMAEEARVTVGGNDQVKIGCMIELPSAALIADILAKESHFFSIGTNDLVQYALAVDRCDPAMTHLYQPSHPSILRMIVNVIKEAKTMNISVSVCGEIAANPKYTSLLLGLGIQELSVAARHIPLIRETVKGLKLSKCKTLAKKALSLSSALEIDVLLESVFKSHSQHELLGSFVV